MDKYIGIVIVYALLLAVYASIKKKALITPGVSNYGAIGI